MMGVHQEEDSMEDQEEDSMEDLQVVSLAVDLAEVFLEVVVPLDNKLNMEIVSQKQKIKSI